MIRVATPDKALEPTVGNFSDLVTIARIVRHRHPSVWEARSRRAGEVDPLSAAVGRKPGAENGWPAGCH